MEDSDDVDDVDWEGGESEEEGADDGQGKNEEDQTLNIAIQVGPESVNGKKTKKPRKVNPVKRVIFTEDDHEVCIQRCQDDLDEKMTLELNFARAASSELITAAMLAEVPEPLLPITQYKRRFDQWIAAIRWMKETFRTVSTKDMTVEEGRDGSYAADLEQFVLANRAGSSHQLNQLFVALMLNLNYQVRLVTTVDLVSCAPQEHADLYQARWRAAQGENTTAVFKDRKYAKAGEKHSWLEVFYEPMGAASSSTVASTRISKTATVIDLAAVVDLTDLTDDNPSPSASAGSVTLTPCTATNVAAATTTTSSASRTASVSERARWVHVDPASQRIDLPSHVEDVLRKGRPLQYVLAYEYARPCAHHASSTNSKRSSDSSNGNSSSSGRSSSGNVGVTVVDVTSTYKRHHHYTTRRDKETHALLDSYLASSIQEFNRTHTGSTIARANSYTHDAGANCNNNSSVHGPSPKLSRQSTVQTPFDLCSDDDNDDAVVDLTDEPDADAGAKTSMQGVSSQSHSENQHSHNNINNRNGSSSSQHRNYTDYDCTDFTDQNDYVEVTDFTVPAQSSSNSSSKRKRAESPPQYSFTSVPSNASSSSSSGVASADQLTRHPLPSKFQDFKDHPVYFLERHILSEQALHPRAYAVALFKGESVYLQTHRETLRTKLQWRRGLKQVRLGEEPIKVVQRSVRTQTGGGDGEGGEENKTIELKLFGSWQTEKIDIKPIVDGIIPMNAHGNIEVWEGRADFVPAGAIFIDNPAAIKTARSLELPCAPAVVGFERRGMHTVPIIGGVVVLRQHAAIVQDASYFVEAVREENVYLKREKEMTAKWERMAFGVLSRQKLREKYGH